MEEETTSGGRMEDEEKRLQEKGIDKTVTINLMWIFYIYSNYGYQDRK